VTFGVSPDMSGYTLEQSQAILERVEAELAAIPGVTGVTSTAIRVLGNSNWGTGVSVTGLTREPDGDYGSRTSRVGPDYFRTLGAELVAGRDFTIADGRNAARVAIVNETFVKKFKLGSDAVGKFMAEGETDTLNTQIVGVVRDKSTAMSRTRRRRCSSSRGVKTPSSAACTSTSAGPCPRHNCSGRFRSSCGGSTPIFRSKTS
jgi:hypothetical protein